MKSTSPLTRALLMVAAFLMVAILLPFTLPFLLAQALPTPPLPTRTGGAGERVNLRASTGTIQTRAQKGYVQLLTAPSYGAATPRSLYPFVSTAGAGAGAGAGGNSFKLNPASLSFDVTRGSTNILVAGETIPPGTPLTFDPAFPNRSAPTSTGSPNPLVPLIAKIGSTQNAVGGQVVTQTTVEVTYGGLGDLDDQKILKAWKGSLIVRDAAGASIKLSKIPITFK